MSLESKYEVIWPFIRSGAVPRSGLSKGVSAQMKPYIYEQVFQVVMQFQMFSEEELYRVLDDTSEHLRSIDQNCKKEYFGNTQKFVNLCLKAIWMCGWTESPPPHFPIDRIIQKAIDNGRSYHEPYAWTDMSRRDYQFLINANKRYLSSGPFQNIPQSEWSQWEMETYRVLMEP